MANLGLDNPLGLSEFTRTLGHSRVHSEITRTTSLGSLGPKSPPEVLKRRGQSSLGQARLQPGQHLLHQSERERGSNKLLALNISKIIPVGDAWTAALCQLKSIFQLFNCISVTATTGAVLASQLEMFKIYI